MIQEADSRDGVMQKGNEHEQFVIFKEKDEDGREIVQKKRNEVCEGQKRNKFIKVRRLSSSEDFVRDRQELVI